MKRDDVILKIESVHESGIHLDAVQLFANWGFGDGEMLQDHPVFLRALAELGAQEDEVDAREVLSLLIERYLLPALPAPLRTYRLEFTSHNPVRAEDDEIHRRPEFEGFGVLVSGAQVVDILRDRVPRKARRTQLHPKAARPQAARSAQQGLPFPHELIIDNFAGGGGTSTGLEAAFGRPVDIAINHDPEALAMHALNHPRTQHLLQSVWDVNPIAVTGNQPVALVWLSPDCKHFSKAKGGTPVAKHIRGLAWVGLRWVALTKPRVLMLENVEEFTTWGPLLVGTDGMARPDPARKGKTFASFVRQLRGHGYNVEWRELRACDHGAPTIRKRLFLVARRDGLPIVWPDATHGDPTSPEVLAGKLLPWRTAAECINFNLPANSIFDRERPLVRNTFRRVAKGVWRHVLSSPRPFIVNTRNGERRGQQPRVRSVNDPYWTVTGLGSQGALAQPIVTPFVNEHANASNQRTMAANEPLRTICAQVKGGHFSVVAPTLAPMLSTASGETSADGMTAEDIGFWNTMRMFDAAVEQERADESLRAPTREKRKKPTLGAGAEASQRGKALTGKLSAAALVPVAHGERRPGEFRTADLERPIGTLHAGGGSFALAGACLEQAYGGFYEDNSGRSVDAPISTIMSKGANQRLITAYCVKYYSSGGQWQGLSDPMHTLPTKGRMGLVEVEQVPADCLAPEQRARARQCAALLHEHLPELFTEPADLVLMFHNGQWWALIDITLRMLKAPELFLAQSFPSTYKIDEIPDPALLFAGGVQAADPLTVPRIKLSGTAQVRMCGNSVAPIQAEKLVRANFAHELLIYGRAAA